MRTRTLVALIALTGCSSDPSHADDDTSPGDTDDDTSPGDTDDTVPPARGCRGTPGPADRARAVVVSLPYDEGGGPASAWEVLTLDPDGTLARPGHRFEMGRAFLGVVRFTPDGSLGLVAQEGGTLGVFTLDDQFRPTVVEAAWNDDGGFYATDVVVAPEGDRAWVIDGNWPENGGGIYEIALDCETGAPHLVRQVLPGKLPSALHLRPDGRAVVVARELDGRGPADLFTLSGWPDAPEVTGSATLFDDDLAIFAGSAVTADGRWALVGDNSLFAEADNSVAFARIDGARPVRKGYVAVEDPVAVLPSPFNDAVLVASGFGDAVVVLSYDPDADVPFARKGVLAGGGPGPLLPGSMVGITRGPLEGHVLIAENVAIRQARFDGSGGVDDLGPFALGEGTDAVPGALGVQP